MKRASNLSLITAFLFCVSIVSCSKEPVGKSLPRSTPEAEGVSSKAILTFLDSAAANKRTEFHSFMFLRHGKVIAEGWWNPFSPELKHTLYSTSKSFTATAVGLAIKEKKLSLDDKVASFFPESLPDTITVNLSELKIKDLLSMSVGQRREAANTGNDWIKTFLATPVEFEPGSRYRYNSMATFMLSAIVQKVTGEKVVDYLTPRLFEPLAIEGVDWETNPQGINTGGWGLRVKTEDMAKFGQLYLQEGKWNGKQILSKEWVREATSLKIYQNPDMTQSKRDSSHDGMQGYCYQFWRAKNNSYMANGADGQFILVIPDKDVVVVFTAESGDMWGELDMVWKYLYPGISDKALPSDDAASGQLKDRLASLAIPAPVKTDNVGFREAVSGKTIKLAENQRMISSMNLEFNDDLCLLNIKTDSTSYDLSFTSGNWLIGETTMYGPYLFSRAKGNRAGLPPFTVAGAYTWTDDRTLELTLRYIDCMHTRRIYIQFDEKNKVLVSIKDSRYSNNNAPPIEGMLEYRQGSGYL